MARVAMAWVMCSLGLLACGPAPSRGGGDDDDDEGAPAPAVFDYVDVEGAVCGNGTPLGLGVSPGSSRTLVVLIAGGGACWDGLTCFTLNAASHLQDTYDAVTMAADLQPALDSGLLTRRRDDNPFTRDHLAFVPYCTGDLHGGQSVRTYQVDLFGQDLRTVHHAGRTNAALFAAELARRFPTVQRVILLGLSAGGFGAVLDHDVYADRFAGARVDVFADGAPFVPPQNGLYGQWQTQWSLALPEDCAGCATDLAAVVGHRRATRPRDRFALVSTTNDEVIRNYFGYGVASLAGPINALLDAHYDDAPNARAFVVEGTEHVLLGGWETRTAPSGVTLRDWLGGFVDDDDDAWPTVRP
jgi:hypothetical protein